MNLNEIASSTRHYNFHSHTQFCDGRADMATFAAAACDCGMEHYGFSPHSPLRGMESPCNMSFDNVGAYLDEVKRLRGLYAGRLNLYASMEIDYLDDSWGPSDPYFRNLPLDYRIGSVHFIPSDDGFIDIDGRFENFKVKMERHFANDIRYVVETFYSQSRRMIEAGGFDILGHFDKIGHNASHFKPGIEDEKWYADLVGGIIDMIIERNLTIELNTKAWADHHRMFPGQRYLKRLAEAEVNVLVNSDVHYPDLIEASRREGFGMLEEAGFRCPPDDAR